MEQIKEILKSLFDSLPPAYRPVGILVGAILAGLVVQHLILLTIGKIEKRKWTFVDHFSMTAYLKGPVKLLIPLFFVRFTVPFITVPEGFEDFLKDFLSLFLIGIGAWLLARALDLGEALFLSFYKVDVEDNLEARKVHTQVRYIKRVGVVAIIILAVGSMLMLFEKVRQFGVGIMTSAGIAGIVIGLAAQKSIANLLTGVQIAVTQPIRLDDVVIVENEWGWIEEITSTYVVVRLWDLRRLIVPLTYFTEKPFQNWTRTSANIIGSVFIYVDYSTPLEEIRSELHRILKKSELWDRRTWVLQVTNSTEKTMELRALMSAKNAPRAWDLRCEVREKLIVWLQKNYPSSLPRFRVETEAIKVAPNDGVGL